MHPLSSTAEAVILVTALSLDAFVASFAYGTEKIKIPFISLITINLICSLILAVSLILGAYIRPFIPALLADAVCFSLLFFLGLIKLFDSTIKSLIKKHKDIKKEYKISMFNLHFILNIYADPEKADMDSSKSLSPAEATSLAVALSLDGLAAGFGAALGQISIPEAVGFSFLLGMTAVMSGCFIGNKIAEKIPVELSWVGGLLLIVLAFMKL